MTQIACALSTQAFATGLAHTNSFNIMVGKTMHARSFMPNAYVKRRPSRAILESGVFYRPFT
jgi:hypothetical protein